VAQQTYWNGAASHDGLTQIRWKRLSQPQSEPVSLNQAKSHLGIAAGDATHDDRLFLAIQAAREEWERDTQTATTEGEFRQVFQSDENGTLPLALRPVTVIDSITYIDQDGGSQTLSTDVYELDEYTQTVRLKPDQSWPATQSRFDAISVNFTAGQSVGQVRADVKQAMLLKIENHIDALSGTIEGERNSNAYEMMVRKHIRASYP
jgi:uncharacterized phiE125 gp8 family phage protein